MRRRDLLRLTGAAGLAGAVAPRAIAHAGPKATAPWWFYASAGSRLSAFAVAPREGGLHRVAGPYDMAEEVQSCWASSDQGILYVASSDQNTRRQGRHFVEAFRIGRGGELTRLAQARALESRPIDITADAAGRYILLAHNRPAGVSVFELNADGSVGDRVAQPAGLEAGVYPHQIRMFPSQAAVLVPARGNDPSASAPEEPGSLRVFDFRSGRLGNVQQVSPGQGLGFRPRHAAFHPHGRWLYVGLESQNQVQAYEVSGDRISTHPVFATSTLSQSARPGQLVSAVVMHPSGRALYVTNRGTGTEAFHGAQVSAGENTVAVFRLDQKSGEPRLIQSAAIPGVHARTIALSPDGEWLAAATILPARVRVGDDVQTQAAGLTLFRVRGDGRLIRSSKLDLDTSEGPVFWVGSASAPASRPASRSR